MLRSLNFTRYFAASGRKSKTAGESISAVGRFINSEGRSAELDVKLVEEETDRILNNFEKELSKLRIGKASPCIISEIKHSIFIHVAMLDSIKIDLSSYVAPLTSLATISVLDTQKLTVAPYDSTVWHIFLSFMIDKYILARKIRYQCNKFCKLEPECSC